MLFSSARAFTFDCYGTLIDWDTGTHTALRAIPALDGLDLNAFILRREQIEMEIEAGSYLPYDTVLARCVSDSEAREFAASVPNWPAFSDASSFLRRLHALDKPFLILSNITNGLLRQSIRKLGVPFDALRTCAAISPLLGTGLRRLGGSACGRPSCCISPHPPITTLNLLLGSESLVFG